MFRVLMVQILKPKEVNICGFRYLSFVHACEAKLHPFTDAKFSLVLKHPTVTW